jgi:hypothetical protein
LRRFQIRAFLGDALNCGVIVCSDAELTSPKPSKRPRCGSDSGSLAMGKNSEVAFSRNYSESVELDGTQVR